MTLAKWLVGLAVAVWLVWDVLPTVTFATLDHVVKGGLAIGLLFFVIVSFVRIGEDLR